MHAVKRTLSWTDGMNVEQLFVAAQRAVADVVATSLFEDRDTPPETSWDRLMSAPAGITAPGATCAGDVDPSRAFGQWWSLRWREFWHTVENDSGPGEVMLLLLVDRTMSSGAIADYEQKSQLLGAIGALSMPDTLVRSFSSDACWGYWPGDRARQGELKPSSSAGYRFTGPVHIFGLTELRLERVRWRWTRSSSSWSAVPARVPATCTHVSDWTWPDR